MSLRRELEEGFEGYNGPLWQTEWLFECADGSWWPFRPFSQWPPYPTPHDFGRAEWCTWTGRWRKVIHRLDSSNRPVETVLLEAGEDWSDSPRSKLMGRILDLAAGKPVVGEIRKLLGCTEIRVWPDGREDLAVEFGPHAYGPLDEIVREWSWVQWRGKLARRCLGI